MTGYIRRDDQSSHSHAATAGRSSAETRHWQPLGACQCHPVFPQTKSELDVEVLYFQRVVFDELAAAFDVFAHEHREEAFGFAGFF